MSDLKGELASLRIDRPLLLFVPVVLVLGVLYGLRARQALSAPEVETARATVARQGEASAGAPILTASGYVVARRKAVVSAKIQGRLAALRVEEGSRVRQNEVIARLESQDYEAQVQRARAALQRAEADLAESRRQLDLARRLTEQKIMSTDQLQTTESRVRVNEAAVSQARADVAFAQAQLANTVIRAPFSGTVVKKMAEVGESVAPIRIGGREYVDGGAWSVTNLDVAPVSRGTRVLCLEPTGALGLRSAAFRVATEIELQALRRRRADVRRVMPDHDSAALMGVLVMVQAYVWTAVIP